MVTNDQQKKLASIKTEKATPLAVVEIDKTPTSQYPQLATPMGLN